MPLIQEHSISLKLTLPQKDVHAKMDVFYNPLMASNRNISILLLNSLPNTKMNLADPLAGSGIRSLRFLKELKKGKINTIFVNDVKDNFSKVFTTNCKENKIPTKMINLSNEDASLFLLHHTGFDYIDIDPFGSPNPFLAAAVARISRKGILAITATDTAALTGTYPKVTPRKYWAASLKNYLMHEIGLRILIRKVQLQGMQFDKVLVPILSYHQDHYFRVYFQSGKGKDDCDAILQQHQFLHSCPSCLAFSLSKYNVGRCCRKAVQVAGPLWVGSLSDKTVLTKMAKNNPFPEEQKFLDTLAKEATMDTVGFYDLHEIAHNLKKEPPKMEAALEKLKAVRTHFSMTGIKTKESIGDFE